MNRPLYRYGSSFTDRGSGLRFEAHHPATRPDRWRAYVDGVAREYERYGIGEIIDRAALERGDGVSVFFVGVDADDQVVAGLRCHGPLDEAASAQALAEVARSPEWAEHRQAIAALTPHGVVEIKGAWRQLSGDGNHQVTKAMARCCVHAAEWLGAEVLLASVADRMRPLMAGVGSLMMGKESAPYPSDRYRTILTQLRRSQTCREMEPQVAQLLRQDAEDLRRSSLDGPPTGWRPIVLDPRQRADRQILVTLRSDPGVFVIDALDCQRKELAQLLPTTTASLMSEAPRHVYYPWRRVLVKILGPESFRAVRLDRNRNRITRAEQDRLRRQRVGIVGLSSGHAVATTLALEGLCGELRLADFDDIGLTNLNRIPASIFDVGVNKAVVAARRVSEIDPYLPVQIVPDGLTVDNVDAFAAGLDLVIEQCDEIGMKVLVREIARRQGVPVVMETSDRGLLDVERFDLEPERPLFHGLLGDVTAEELRSLSTEEKIPHVLAIVEPDKASARGAASLAEIGRTLTTWPQLGSDVTLGGASVAAAVRQIGLGVRVPSGRTRVDIDAALATLESPGGGARDELRDADDVPTEQPAGTAGAAWAPPRDPVLSIVHAATMAPSCGNGQPWQFALDDRHLDVELVRARGCGVMDVGSRASYVGLGAAIFNARVAAARVNRLGAVHLFPHGPSSDVVATLALEGGSDDELADLYAPMLQRCSNRRHGQPAPLDLAVGGQLVGAATAEGATLHLVTDPERLAECAEVLRAAERIRFLTAALRNETMREMRWPGGDVRRGIDVATLELSSFEMSSLQLMRRHDVMELLDRWDAGDALGDYLKSAVLSSSAIAVVSMSNQAPAAYVTGGMALERVWIEVQRLGLAVHAIAPSFLYAVQAADYEKLVGARWADELRTLSERFRSIVSIEPTAALALVLRLSHAPPPTARSIRLGVDEVLRRK